MTCFIPSASTDQTLLTVSMEMMSSKVGKEGPCMAGIWVAKTMNSLLANEMMALHYQV